ncbi:MAG: protein kinase [Deltaproteobacteria bacterium]|nr:protein kinase [Deltaproteobacteria bacterium]
MLPSEQKYEVISEIASGGMATVYVGRTTAAADFERIVALKVMHPHLAKENEYVEMFLDEARLAARIRHPNVVATLDVVDDEVPFLVMELVEGPTLRGIMKDTIRRLANIPTDVGLRIVTDTLLGLHAAHELTGGDGKPLHLVHRDVSPQNVLVGADGTSRIADFGVARAAVRLATTRSGQVKGKVHFMAPEQVTGDGVDCRADVYAAGAILWEVLAGERRLKGEGEVALMYEVVQGTMVGPAERNADVHPELDAVCQRALARNPDHRFPTAAAFADAIEQAAQSVGCGIASQRAVARYVEQLDVHVKPDTTGTGSYSRPIGTPASRMRRKLDSQATEDGPSGDPASEPPIQAVEAKPSRRGRRVLALGAIVVVAGGATALVALSPEAAEPAVETTSAPDVAATAPLPTVTAAPSAPTTLTTSAAETTSSAEVEMPPQPPALPVTPPPTWGTVPTPSKPTATTPGRPSDFQPSKL